MWAKPSLLRFTYEDFARSYEADLNAYIVYYRPQLDCNRNSWFLKLQCGQLDDDNDRVCITQYPIWFTAGQKQKNRCSVSIAMKNADGEIVNDIDGEYPRSTQRTEESWHDMTIPKILDPNNKILIDGALCIDVIIQVKDRLDDQYDPESELSNKMMKLLESGVGSDTSFNVGGQTFPVHSSIIHNNAPILALYLAQGNKTDVGIKDISAAVFKMVLAFVYAEQRPSVKEVLDHGREIIDAANRYELTDLMTQLQG